MNAILVESSRLQAHVSEIYFDRRKPLAIYFPEIDSVKVNGPFYKEDYAMENIFSRQELEIALKKLNTQAGIGPGRVSSKWLVKIFATDSSKEFLLFLFNQCYCWGRMPSSWSNSELFVNFKEKEDRKEPVNYWAINHLDDFYQVYSCLLYVRLMGWAERFISILQWRNSVFNQHQVPLMECYHCRQLSARGFSVPIRLLLEIS